MNNVEFENILDTCIAEVRAGRATVEDCLQRYAAHALALEPLLREALRLAALPQATMSADAIDALEQRVLSRAAQIRATRFPRGRTARRAFRSLLTDRKLWLWAVASGLVIVLAIAGAWIASAPGPPGQITSSATPQPSPSPSRTSSPSLTPTPRATPTATSEPTRTSEPTKTPKPVETPEPGEAIESKTPRFTETAEPSETPGRPEGLKPDKTPKPTETAELSPTPDLTATPSPTPTEAAEPMPDGWDKSSLHFDEGYGCQGNCEAISVQVCNGGDSEDMAGATAWELYWTASGNPKSGTLVAGGSIGPLAAGQCQTLAYNPGGALYGNSGSYAFKAYQRSGHPGTGVLWSSVCEITCGASPTQTPEPTPAPKPTRTPKPTKTPKPEK